MRWAFVLASLALALPVASDEEAAVKTKRAETAELTFPNENVEQEEADSSKKQTPKAELKPAVRDPNELELDLPVVLPPENVSDYEITDTNSCLLYLEGVNIILWKKENDMFRNVIIGPSGQRAEDPTTNIHKFLWNNGFVNCSDRMQANTTFGVFTVKIKLTDNVISKYETKEEFQINSGEVIWLQLTFNDSSDDHYYWRLIEVKVLGDLTIRPAGDDSFLSEDLVLSAGSTSNNNAEKTKYMGVESFLQYGYACSLTQATFLAVKDNAWSVGIGFSNLQVDLKAYVQSVEGSKKHLVFNRDMYDCVGTFSVGSWMGIVCSLVLASILLFGYLMLQSVQTMDRFDDPKQKQIVINFKE